MSPPGNPFDDPAPIPNPDVHQPVWPPEQTRQPTLPDGTPIHPLPPGVSVRGRATPPLNLAAANDLLHSLSFQRPLHAWPADAWVQLLDGTSVRWDHDQQQFVPFYPPIPYTEPDTALDPGVHSDPRNPTPTATPDFIDITLKIFGRLPISYNLEELRNDRYIGNRMLTGTFQHREHVALLDGTYAYYDGSRWEFGPAPPAPAGTTSPQPLRDYAYHLNPAIADAKPQLAPRANKPFIAAPQPFPLPSLPEPPTEPPPSGPSFSYELVPHTSVDGITTSVTLVLPGDYPLGSYVFVISAVHTISAVTVTASGDLPLGQITSGYADQGDMKVSCFRAQLTTAAALNPVVTLTADASVGPWATLVLTYVPDPITSASQNLHDINTYNYAALPDIGLTVPADEPSLGSGEDYVYLGFHATNNTARTVTPSLGWITGGTVASTEAADNVGITWQHRHGQGEPVRPDAATDAPGDWWISFAHAIFVAEPSTAITPATPTPEDPG